MVLLCLAAVQSKAGTSFQTFDSFKLELDFLCPQGMGLLHKLKRASIENVAA
jgi:hypothetical protein